MNAPDIWRPTADLATLRRRADLLARARGFFSRREMLEVETPLIGDCGVTETHVESIAVVTRDDRFWLRTSPEYHMKRLLAAGSPDIYQIAKCFRGGEKGSRHQIEFTMIEWYRQGFNLAQMYDECCQLIIEMSNDADHPVDEIRVQSYADLFRQHCNVDPLTADATTLETAACRLLDSATCAAVSSSLRINSSTWLDLLASYVVHPALSPDVLHVITEYPAEQAMLARLHPDNPAVAERFEIFLNGLELANGFQELRDAKEQEKRFVRDRERRAELGLPDMLADPRLLAALESGLPECCGVALGLDRTMMAIAKLEKIEMTLAFSPGS